MSDDDGGLTSGADLGRAIEKALEGVPTSQLSKAARQLSERYRAGDDPYVRTELDVLAYVAVRMPATLAAAREALARVRQAAGEWEPASQLDLGAGTGSAAWAAASVWPRLHDVVLAERDEAMRRLGAALAAHDHPGWSWQLSEVTAKLPSADLVTACYVLGELGSLRAAEVALAAWRATSGCLLIVEPGTPVGFALVRELRAQLIGAGGRIVAPCPGDGDCPMTEHDWCHFVARLGRSALHRNLKGAERSFEDEKFSYVAVSRLPSQRPAGRVLRRPVVRRRFVELTLCTGDDVCRSGVGRSSAAYPAASRLSWGDGVAREVMDGLPGERGGDGPGRAT